MGLELLPILVASVDLPAERNKDYLGSKLRIRRHLDMLKFSIALIALLAFTAAAHADGKPSKSCSEEDFVTYVSAGSHCLAIQTLRETNRPDVLVVFLHGAVSRGGPADYFNEWRTDAAIARRNVVTVTIMRPGYYTRDGRYSSGSNGNRSDTTTKSHNVTIAQGISRLKAAYQPKRVVAVGHSAGALTIGGIIGMAPGLIDTAILVSCPCDTRRFARHHGFRTQKRQNPMSVVSGVTSATKVIAVTGAEDKNTTPWTVESYVSALRKKGC